jgi:hypothetical protein
MLASDSRLWWEDTAAAAAAAASLLANEPTVLLDWGDCMILLWLEKASVP